GRTPRPQTRAGAILVGSGPMVPQGPAGDTGRASPAVAKPRWQPGIADGYPWVVSEHETSSLTPEQRAHQAEAQREVLLEAMEIFTHDLSNPLQSLIVLTELALDDTPEGTEEYDRCRQSLEAAERMRTLVQGLAGLTRSID